MEFCPIWGFHLPKKRYRMFSVEQIFSVDEWAQDFVRIPGKRWSLVQIRPRNEKFSAKNLTRQGIVVYLPLLTKVEIHNRSKREIRLPMFPGYLFACPSLEEETIIRRDKGVWNMKVLSGAEEELLLRDLKIVREAELLSSAHKLIMKPGIRVGDTVQMKSGPFKNHEVVVVKRENETQLVVNLEFLGRNISIRCIADDLKI